MSLAKAIRSGNWAYQGKANKGTFCTFTHPSGWNAYIGVKSADGVVMLKGPKGETLKYINDNEGLIIARHIVG